MSLKAKLEAVIYAAEEPVTLAQLGMLFADEALAWKSERDAARAAQVEENEDSGEDVEESLLLLEGEDPTPVMAAAPAPDPVLEAEQGAGKLFDQPPGEACQLAGSETEGDAATTGDSQEDDASKSAEAEARRLVRAARPRGEGLAARADGRADRRLF